MTRLNVPNVKLRHGMVWNLEFHNSSHEYHELRPHHMFRTPSRPAKTWILQPFGDDFPIKTMIPGLGRDQIYPDPMNKWKKTGNFPSKPMAKPPGTTKASLRTAAASSSTATAPVRDRRLATMARWQVICGGVWCWDLAEIHGETWWNHRKSAGNPRKPMEKP